MHFIKEDHAMNNDSIIEKSAKGIAISYGVLIFTSVILFVRQIILARLLLPEDFGLIAFVSVIIGFVSIFSAIKGSETIIQTKHEPQKMLNTAFTLQMIVSSFSIILLFMLSPYIASILGKPHITPFLQVLSFTLIGGALSLPISLFVKSLDFKMAKLPEFVSAIFSSITAVSLAFMGYCVWSLVYGTIMGMLTSIIVIWIITPLYPKLEIDKNMAKDMFNFAWPLFALFVLVWIFWNADDFMVGMILGDTALGYYWLAFYIPHYLIQIKGVLGSVSFPAFSKVQDQNDSLKSGFETLTKYSTIIILSFCSVLIPLAKPTIFFIFGEEWLPAVIPFTIFVALVAQRSIFGHWTEIYMSIGKTKTLLITYMINPVCLFALGPLLTIKYGIVGMAIAVFIPQILSIPIAIYLVKKVIDVSFTKLLWKPTLSFMITASITSIFKFLITDIKFYIIGVVGFLLLYYAIIVLLDKTFIPEIKSYIKMVID